MAPAPSRQSAGLGEGAAGKVTAVAPRRRKGRSGLGTDGGSVSDGGAIPMAQERGGRRPNGGGAGRGAGRPAVEGSGAEPTALGEASEG